MGLKPGEMVGDNLRLVRQVGRGAMGSVWVADHLGLQSQVAVKFMLSASLDDPVSVARFRQEAKAAAEIRSPHVVQVFDHGVTGDGENYIVMELLHGVSLGERIKQSGAMPLAKVVQIVSQACKALAKAHTRGISHRDIKPDNIFLGDSAGDMHVKVLDFGVAKFSGQEAINMTAVGNMVGTPAFMSPEQLFDGFELDHRGDLWSLAVVAYYALTAERPFTGATLGELCVSVKLGEYKSVSQLRPDLPREVDGFFDQALHRDIKKRFQTAKELAVALEKVAGVASTMSSTPSSVAVSMPLMSSDAANQLLSASKLARRRRQKGALIGGVLVAVSVATLVFLLGPGQRTPAPSTTTRPAAEQEPYTDESDAADERKEASSKEVGATPQSHASAAASGAPGASENKSTAEKTTKAAAPSEAAGNPQAASSSQASATTGASQQAAKTSSSGDPPQPPNTAPPSTRPPAPTASTTAQPQPAPAPAPAAKRDSPPKSRTERAKQELGL